MEKVKTLELDRNLKTIIVFGLRYSLPRRHSYAFGLTSEYICKIIQEFTDDELKRMLQDCEIFYPDEDLGGSTCDQPMVDKFIVFLKKELARRAEQEN